MTSTELLRFLPNGYTYRVCVSFCTPHGGGRVGRPVGPLLRVSIFFGRNMLRWRQQVFSPQIAPQQGHRQVNSRGRFFGSVQLPLPLGCLLKTRQGFHWSDYITVVAASFACWGRIVGGDIPRSRLDYRGTTEGDAQGSFGGDSGSPAFLEGTGGNIGVLCTQHVVTQPGGRGVTERLVALACGMYEERQWCRSMYIYLFIPAARRCKVISVAFFVSVCSF